MWRCPTVSHQFILSTKSWHNSPETLRTAARSSRRGIQRLAPVELPQRRHLELRYHLSELDPLERRSDSDTTDEAVAFSGRIVGDRVDESVDAAGTDEMVAVEEEPIV